MIVMPQVETSPPMGGWTIMLEKITLYYLITIYDRWLWFEIVTLGISLWCWTIMSNMYVMSFISQWKSYKKKECCR
jgi:hypothetical protein